MIKIVESILVRSLDRHPDTWVALDFVPATATLEISGTWDENGRSEVLKLNATVPRKDAVLEDNLCVRVYWSNGGYRDIGTEDFPVRFEIEETDVIRISVEWRCPVL